LDRQPAQLPAKKVERIRRSRRHPRLTQFDFLHLQRLLKDLREALASIDHPVRDVVDVYCGSRPYDDLLPPSARYTGLDVDGRYGVADVVSREFLPFEDDSFDLVLCIEAFQYVPDPEVAVAEFARVLRPRGTAIIALPFVWEYDRTYLERRYTGPELEALFAGWQTRLVENGGRVVAWATLTGSLLHAFEGRTGLAGMLLRPLFAGGYLLVNAFAAALDAVDRRYTRGPFTLPMNLLLVARRTHV
jgi:SAM-dependent methyltransferase